MDESELFAPGDLPEEFRLFLGSVRDISFPPQGCTSQVAVVESARGKFVLKRALGEQWRAWLMREERALRALSASGLAIPRPHRFVSTGEPDEAWLLMDFLHGETMGQALAGERDETTRHNLLHAFGQTLRSIHQTPVPPALARPDRPWLDARLDEAADNLARFPVDGSPALLDWLRRNQPPVVPPTLIHGDFTLDNVLVQEGRVSGIIDWSDGSLGDPRYDLALATRPDEGLFQSPADFQAFAAGYGAGLPPAEIHEYFVGLYEFF